MSEIIRSVPLSAFREAVVPGHHGNTDGIGGITVVERTNVMLAEIIVFGKNRTPLAKTLNARYQLELPQQGFRAIAVDCALAWSGFNRWMFETSKSAEIDQLKLDLQGIAAVVNQTDGRCLLRLEGPQAEKVLQKGLKIDLHRNVFTDNNVALTIIEEIEASVCRISCEPACFDVTISRSMAESFWRWLHSATEEYGLMVVD